MRAFRAGRNRLTSLLVGRRCRRRRWGSGRTSARAPLPPAAFLITAPNPAAEGKTGSQTALGRRAAPVDLVLDRALQALVALPGPGQLDRRARAPGAAGGGHVVGPLGRVEEVGRLEGERGAAPAGLGPAVVLLVGDVDARRRAARRARRRARGRRPGPGRHPARARASIEQPAGRAAGVGPDQLVERGQEAFRAAGDLVGHRRPGLLECLRVAGRSTDSPARSRSPLRALPSRRHRPPTSWALRLVERLIHRAPGEQALCVTPCDGRGGERTLPPAQPPLCGMPMTPASSPQPVHQRLHRHRATARHARRRPGLPGRATGRSALRAAGRLGRRRRRAGRRAPPLPGGPGVRARPGPCPGRPATSWSSEARGDLLLFLDDDITFDPDLLARYAGLAAERPEVGVFGGPNDTPPSSTGFQFVQGAVLASMVGSGPVRRRYGAHPAGPAGDEAFILCNLAVRRDVMVPLPRRLPVRRGERPAERPPPPRAWSCTTPPSWSSTTSAARRRGASPSRCTSTAGAGACSLRREPATLRPWYLAPSAFLAYLLVLPLLVLAFGPLVALPVAAYAGAVLAGGRLDRPDPAPPRGPSRRGRAPGHAPRLLRLGRGAGPRRSRGGGPAARRAVVARHRATPPPVPPTRSTSGTAPATTSGSGRRGWTARR